jgi:hypothetical protein
VLGLFFASAVIAACSREERRATGQAPAAVSSPSVAPSNASPSFSRDVAPYLAKNCAQGFDCHGDKPTGAVDLDLRPAAAYGMLVGAASPARPKAIRVVPGDPARSFLVDKMTGKLGRYEGKQMPLDPATGAPLPPSPERDAFVEHVLRPWILAGAKDD